jgi:hypothetical protein
MLPLSDYQQRIIEGLSLATGIPRGRLCVRLSVIDKPFVEAYPQLCDEAARWMHEKDKR